MIHWSMVDGGVPLWHTGSAGRFLFEMLTMQYYYMCTNTGRGKSAMSFVVIDWSGAVAALNTPGRAVL